MMSLLSFLMMLIPSIALAGSSAGNGADLKVESIPRSWFNDKNATVTYCYAVDPRFGPIRASELEPEINQALKTWVDYLTIKRRAGSKAASKNSLPTQFRMKNYCDGGEHLKFYFGVIDPQIEGLMTQYTLPMGFSAQTRVDNSPNGMGRGLIWISNPELIGSNLSWFGPGRLSAILVHELGHVLGADHLAGTVMETHLGKTVLSRSSASLFAIDQGRELLSCDSCTYEFEDQGQPHLSRQFKKFLGRAPVGQVTAKLTLREGKAKRGSLTLKDAVSSYTLSIAADKKLIETKGEGHFNQERAGNGDIYFGWMSHPDGRKTPISLSRNQGFYAGVKSLDDASEEDQTEDVEFFRGTSYRILD